jgi:hypothetical protein
MPCALRMVTIYIAIGSSLAMPHGTCAAPAPQPHSVNTICTPLPSSKWHVLKITRSALTSTCSVYVQCAALVFLLKVIMEFIRTSQGIWYVPFAKSIMLIVSASMPRHLFSHPLKSLQCCTPVMQLLSHAYESLPVRWGAFAVFNQGSMGFRHRGLRK